MTSKLKKAIGAVKDQTSISLAKVASNNSSNLEVLVLRATTHDDVPMEERYVCQILKLVSSNKLYAASCARAIGKRIGRTRNWIVALKSLMLVLRIFQDGDPYFPREVLHAMKRGAKILNLTSFRDDSNSSPWDYTAFIRTFALYLDERLDCFLTGKLQRRYTHGDREPRNRRSRSRRAKEPVRDMKPAMLLDKISNWQRLLDRAIATRPTGAAKSNPLVQISLYAVVQESFELYKDISDGLALLLDSFFHLQYQNCVHAFQTCVKASKQFEELSAFYDLCKSIGVGRTSEYPSVHTISDELIETLQEFLKDQSSFPTTGRSPNKQLLLPAPGSDSYGQSEFSEFGSQCTSLEDLISATELTGASPSISIDLEAYSYSDPLEKQLQRDDAFSVNETGSAKSLPVTNSMVDLISLDEWSQEEQEQETLESSSATGWELVLAETATQKQPPPEQPVESGSADSSRDGWEIVLAETATQSTQIIPNQANGFSALPPPHHYNPFLQDITELTASASASASADLFSSAAAPTFQATPTFCAQNPDDTRVALQNENDPFATFSTAVVTEQMFDGSVNQQNLLQEQQLWLQHQNKIIAKHMA
uniref:ENTH domain-containing protein n=1 Tax=Davidia involucrata TaxID=16924 RepID=A0A5B7BXR3_DAVIN